MVGRRAFVLVVVAVFGILGYAGVAAEQSAAQRGEYLVSIMGCDDCHTPMKMGPKGPEPDMARRFSGHPADFPHLSGPVLPQPWMAATTPTLTAWAGPWGISYSTNLTPDAETGIGSWTAETFIQTMRTGRHMGQGRPLLPPMPLALGRATDEDLKAIFAYLSSVPPIANAVPEAVIAEPGAAPAGAP